MKDHILDVTLEERLVGDNIISRTQLELARTQSAKCNKPVWSLFVKLGYLSEEEIFKFFARQSGIAHVYVDDYEISYEVSDMLPESFCRANQVIPLFQVKDILYVACVNPLDTMLIENIAKMVGCAVEPLIASAASIIRGLNIYYGPMAEAFGVAPLLTRQRNVQGLAYRRETERISARIPLQLRLEDSSLRLHCRTALYAMTRNISANGAAINLQVSLFLPKGILVSLEFRDHSTSSEKQQVFKVLGEIVYSQMEKDQNYLLGIKFKESQQGDFNQILSLLYRNHKDST